MLSQWRGEGEVFREVPGYRIGFRAFSPAAEPYADRRERSHPTRGDWGGTLTCLVVSPVQHSYEGEKTHKFSLKASSVW